MPKPQNRNLKEVIQKEILADKDEELLFHAKIIDGGMFSQSSKVAEMLSRDTFADDDEKSNYKIRVLCLSS